MPMPASTSFQCAMGWLFGRSAAPLFSKLVNTALQVTHNYGIVEHVSTWTCGRCSGRDVVRGARWEPDTWNGGRVKYVTVGVHFQAQETLVEQKKFRE